MSYSRCGEGAALFRYVIVSLSSSSAWTIGTGLEMMSGFLPSAERKYQSQALILGNRVSFSKMLELVSLGKSGVLRKAPTGAGGVSDAST